MNILDRDDNKLALEFYTEMGRDVRQFNSETYATNRLMLPPLVIGLLLLYGNVEKFLGVEFQNAEVVHSLVWFGCVMISLIWICNMSRLAQLSQIDRQTLRESERKLGIKGHRKILETDKKMEKDIGVSKILRHSRLRFFSFGIYFFLLLFKLESMDFHGWLSFLNSIEGPIWWTIFLLIITIVTVYLSFSIYIVYLGRPLRFSHATPTERWDTRKRQFIDTRKRRGPACLLKWILYVVLAFLAILSVLIFVDLRQRPDANVHLERGLTYYAKGDYTEAIECFDNVIALESNGAGAYFNRGSAYYHKGDFARAIIDFDNVIALDSNNSDAREFRRKAQKEMTNSDNR